MNPLDSFSSEVYYNVMGHSRCVKFLINERKVSPRILPSETLLGMVKDHFHLSRTKCGRRDGTCEIRTLMQADYVLGFRQGKELERDLPEVCSPSSNGTDLSET